MEKNPRLFNSRQLKGAEIVRILFLCIQNVQSRAFLLKQNKEVIYDSVVQKIEIYCNI